MTDKSRWVQEAEDGIPIKATKPVTEKDRKHAAEVWAEMTGQK